LESGNTQPSQHGSKPEKKAHRRKQKTAKDQKTVTGPAATTAYRFNTKKLAQAEEIAPRKPLIGKKASDRAQGVGFKERKVFGRLGTGPPTKNRTFKGPKGKKEERKTPGRGRGKRPGVHKNVHFTEVTCTQKSRAAEGQSDMGTTRTLETTCEKIGRDGAKH